MSRDSARGLRVLVVSLGRFGGVTEYGFLMSRALSNRCEIAVVSSAGAENRGKWQALDCPHLEVETFSSLPGMLLSLFNVPKFARISRFARDFDPDVVYYPGGHAWKPVLDLILPRRAKTVLTSHDPDLHAGEDSLLQRLHDSANRSHVDGYVLLNESQQEDFIARNRLARESVTVIPHGVFDDFPREHAPLERMEGLAALAADAGSYLLFLGRIRPYKGVETLLRAYRDLPGEQDIPLVIAGSGEFSEEERGLLQSMSARRIHVVNRWLSDEDISALVASARFVVLPYTSATQSGVVPLASVFGVPAIASDAGGLPEQVVHGKTGWLFSAGDSRALTLAIQDAYAIAEEDYLRMSAEVKRHAEEHWGWASLSAQLVGFFESLLEEAT